MIKKIFIFFIFNISLLAHDEFTLEIIDNKNNTITIIGDEEHKQGLAGALIKVESLISGEILFKDRLPKESKITIDIPKEPYQVVLDTHEEIVVKIGIAPIEGFTSEHKTKAEEVILKLSKEKHGDEEWSGLTLIFFTLCLILFLLTIYFSNKNTNKFMKEFKIKDKER